MNVEVVVLLSKKGLSAVLIVSAASVFATPALSETILGALSKAYNNNSSLNSARADVRVTDEGVAIAKSGNRPRITGDGSISASHQYSSQQSGYNITTGSFGVSIQQSLFDGFQTRNNVRAAEAQVEAADESLRNTEENILFNAASAFMDVIRDREIAKLREQNLDFLGEQVRASNSRLDVGEGTRTDVAQADASRQAAIAQLAAARAQAQASAATYHQVIGNDPGTLRTPRPLAKLLPNGLARAIDIARAEHPAILANEHLVDAADFSVKAAEGTLLPQLSAQASVDAGYSDTSGGGSSFAGLPGVGGGSGGYRSNNSASVGLQLTVPIYQGGLASAQVRQSKETLGRARIDVDVARDQVRQAVTSAWTQYQAAIEAVSANRDLVSAAKLALNGVSEERKVGQRTTLDVLNAQADVITAQINLVSSERDVVVASYAILSAIGRLSAGRLGLQVAVYHPKEHYNAVKDKWYGLRTPDAR